MRLDGKPMPAVQVRAILQVLEMSQADLATEIGSSPRTVYRWCDEGTDGPTAALLRLMRDCHDAGILQKRPVLPNDFDVTTTIRVNAADFRGMYMSRSF